MSEKYANLIWEDNPDTPITASRLSGSVDFHSKNKFITFANDMSDYDEWADEVINILPWPEANEHKNKRVYNMFDQTARRSVQNNLEDYEWQEVTSPFNKILRLSEDTKITTSYLNLNINDIKNETFYFDDEVLISPDDLLLSNDLEPNSFYSIYVYHRYSYGDRAAIKLVNSSYDHVTDVLDWKKDGILVVSPSGFNVISYRKIGGFQTNQNGHILEETLWDLSTYRTELAIERIKIATGDIIKDLDATDVPIVDEENQFNATNVEHAIIETRTILNNLRGSFYNNRRGGVVLRFAQVRKRLPTSNFELVGTNQISLVITAGFIDVFGSEVIFNNDIYLSNSETLELNINDGYWATGRTLGTRQLDGQGRDTRIYPGIWRVFIDQNGRISLKEHNEENSVPIWFSSHSGWYDSETGARCIGKFSVSTGGGVHYIDKISVTNTLDFDPPIGTLFHFHSTLCPDGLIPCDGRWHDITGRDKDSYLLQNLPPVEEWGYSWYEESPNLMGRILRQAETPYLVNTGGAFNFETGQGGSADAGEIGGQDEHNHSFEHDHGTGTINIITGGSHSHSGQFVMSPASETIQVDAVPSGQNVATGNHIHGLLTNLSGSHQHAVEEVIGRTERLIDHNAITENTSSWPPYKDVLICIKK